MTTRPSILATLALCCATAGLPGRATAAAPFDLKAAIAGAKPGATLRLPPGTYLAPVLIDKPLTLVGDGAGVTLQGAGNGDVLVITAPDVTVRNLTIRHTGDNLENENAAVVISAPRVTVDHCRIADALFGINLRDAHNAVIRDNVITGKTDLDIARRGDAIKLWNCNDAVMEDNEVSASRDLVMWYSQRLVIRRNRVHDCRYGVHFMHAEHATVEDNVLSENSVGMFLMYAADLTLRRNVLARNRGPSGFGLGLKDVDGVDATDNVFCDNRVGLHVDNSPSELDRTHTYRKNVFAYNDIALGFMPNTHDNRFTDNTFFDNVEQVAVLGGGELTGNAFTVDGRGNYWSDYRGYDADGDGVGDVPHKSSSVFENLMDRDPRMRMFLFSPAQQAVDLASRAFPVVKPKVRATDTAPLMSPPSAELRAAAGHETGAAPARLAAAALLSIGGLVVIVGRRELAAPPRRRSPCIAGVSPASSPVHPSSLILHP